MGPRSRLWCSAKTEAVSSECCSVWTCRPEYSWACSLISAEKSQTCFLNSTSVFARQNLSSTPDLSFYTSSFLSLSSISPSTYLSSLSLSPLPHPIIPVSHLAPNHTAPCGWTDSVGPSAELEISTRHSPLSTGPTVGTRQPRPQETRPRPLSSMAENPYWIVTMVGIMPSSLSPFSHFSLPPSPLSHYLMSEA